MQWERAKVMERGLDHANQMVAAYLARMKIDRDLLDLAETVKFESVHILMREEIVRFGIDRREFVETPWRFEDTSHAVRKMAIARKADGLSFRRMEWRLFCAGKERAHVMLVRQADKAVAVSHSVTLSAGSGQPLKLAGVAFQRGDYEAWHGVVASDIVKTGLPCRIFRWRTPRLC